MTTIPDRIAALTALAMADAADLRRIVTQGHTAAFIAGTAERLGVRADSSLISRQRLSRAERDEINRAIKGQLQYLENFLKERGTLSPQALKARLALWGGATKTTYYAARWGGWDIPQELLPGTAACLGNCRCSISVRDNGDGTGVLTRVMGGEDHCTACPPLAGDHPVKRRGGAYAVKHGSHDQSTHGRRGPRGRAAAAAYSSARAGGASIQEARAAARDVSHTFLAQRRLANINAQLGGGVSPKQRASLEAERARLQQDIATRVARTPAAGGVGAQAATSKPRQAPKPAGDSPAVQTAKTHETKIRTQKFESMVIIGPDGKVLINKDGAQYSVNVSTKDMRTMQATPGVIFTHNHPMGWNYKKDDPRHNGNSFSPEDLQVATKAGVAEVRAVTPTRTYYMRPPPGGWNQAYYQQQLGPAYERANKDVRAMFTDGIKSGRMTIQEAEARHAHEVWLRVARDLNLDYGYTEP